MITGGSGGSCICLKFRAPKQPSGRSLFLLWPQGFSSMFAPSVPLHVSSHFFCHSSIRSVPTLLVMISNEGERFGVEEEGIIYFLSPTCFLLHFTLDAGSLAPPTPQKTGNITMAPSQTCLLSAARCLGHHLSEPSHVGSFMGSRAWSLWVVWMTSLVPSSVLGVIAAAKTTLTELGRAGCNSLMNEK